MIAGCRGSRAAGALLCLLAFDLALAQDPASSDPKQFQQEELDQMLAPLALYPDDLLSQVLIASTYPLEIVLADRWVKANPGLKEDALTAALEKQSWDPSVKSLVNFPDVLASLSTNLDWTSKIGDAVLADEKAVMETEQKLRAKAKEAGNLESSEQMTVTTESSGSGDVIVIESPSREVVYVPYYDPAVVYGPWWYPAYPPPYYYYPPGYTAGVGVGFGVGIFVGVAWGYAWGGCSWGHQEIDIDIDRNVDINTDIDRGKYKEQLKNAGIGDGKGTWKHDPEHRKGLEYRDSAVAQKFGGTSKAQAIQSREVYRGRADTGLGTGTGQLTPGGRPGSEPLQRPGNLDAGRAGNLDSARTPETPARPSSLDRSSGDRGSAFSDIKSGRSTVRDSARGQASRVGSRGGGRRGR
jgi:hypothetical protein